MSIVTAAASRGAASFHAFTTQARFLADVTHRATSILDNVFGVCSSVSTLIREFSPLDPLPSGAPDREDFSPTLPEFPKLDRLESAVETAAALNCFGYTAAKFSRLVCGSMFFKTDSTGQFVLEKVPTKDGGTGFRKIRKNPFCIAADLCRLGSSVIRSTQATETLGLARLGGHAHTALGGTRSGLNLLASILGLTNDAIEIRDAVQISADSPSQPHKQSCASRFVTCMQRCKEAMFSLICNFIDAVAEILGVLFKAMPSIFGSHGLIIMGILGLLSSVGNLVLDLIS